MYFGLAQGSDGLLYAGCRNTTTYGPESDEVRAAEQGTVLVFDPNLSFREVLLPETFLLRHLHGMACFDGRLWVTTTYDNMVAIHDLASREWTQWYPAPDPADRGRDIHHFNAIAVIEGQVGVLAHKFGPSELYLYEYPNLRLDSVVPLGVMSHNLFSFGSAIGTCSSGEGRIVNRSGKYLKTGGFPRGVGIAREGNLLGISMICPRDQRQLQDGFLRWYAPDWQLKADYRLPRVGMVLDVLYIGDGDVLWNSVEPWPYAEITRGSCHRLENDSSLDSDTETGSPHPDQSRRETAGDCGQ